MNILVTGGAGYLGSILVPQLLKDSHEVTVLDNFMYGQTPLLDHCFRKNLKIIRKDVSEIGKDELKDFDAIVHLACLVGAPLCDKDPIKATAVNLNSVVSLLDRVTTQKFIYPCTNSGYGVGQNSLECDEETPLHPVSRYGLLKVQAERKVLERGGVSLRFATLFGMSPRMRLDLLVNDFVYRALNDRFIVLFESHFKRNYVHVFDAARSIIHSLYTYDVMAGKPFNVGLSEANFSKLELCETIKKHLPGFVILHSDINKDPDQRNYIVSNKRIEATGYRAEITLDDGIEELIKGFQVIKRTQYANA